MATRTMSASLSSPKSTTLYDGDYVYYSSSTSHSGVVEGTINSAYLTLTNFRVYSGSCYMSIYVGGEKVGETVEMDTDDFNGGSTTTVEVEMEYLKDAILWATGEIELHCYNNNSSSAKTYATRSSGTATVTVNYTPKPQPTLGTPAAPTITQNNNGTYTASWSAVSASNGSGSVQYRLWNVSDGIALSSYSTSTSATLNIGAYNYALQFRVEATYSGLTTYGATATKTFYKPSITAPSNLKVTSATGQTCALSWTAAKLNYTTGTITYSIRRNGTEIATTTSTSYTVAESTTKGWGTSASTMTVVAKGTKLSNTVNNTVTTLTSSATSGVSYTYRAAVSTQPSNLKINGGTSYTGATAPLTWSAAAFSGSQTPTYSIRVDGTQIATTTSTSYTIPESTTKSYTAAKTITIVATGGGATSSATNGVTYTYSPTITAASNLKINSATSHTGRTAPLTWTAGSLSNGATVTYSLRKGGAEFATTTNTSYTVTEDVTKGWGTSAVTLTIVATGSGKTASASNSVTYTYQPAFTANPTNLKINGAASYSGQTAPLTWTAATISNGATITYTIYKGTDAVTTTTSTSYTIPESITKEWSGTVSLKIVASASGITSSASSTVSYTYSPTLTNPTDLKVEGASSFIGQTAQLTWTAATLSSGATITYSIRKNGVEFATTTSTSYTIPESIAINWGTNPVTITVFATGSGKVSNSSNEVAFTYKPPYKTIKYNTGTGWVECIAYYHDGTRWVKCDSYYYNGGWKLSDH